MPLVSIISFILSGIIGLEISENSNFQMTDGAAQYVNIPGQSLPSHSGDSMLENDSKEEEEEGRTHSRARARANSLILPDQKRENPFLQRPQRSIRIELPHDNTHDLPFALRAPPLTA
ncbi:hypothetical protein DV872_23085 [Oceanispirochaeta sp. M1]|nr:hypothetical protein DV872_23085 [Oceanispirochaeta sp. M1]